MSVPCGAVHPVKMSLSDHDDFKRSSPATLLVVKMLTRKKRCIRIGLKGMEPTKKRSNSYGLENKKSRAHGVTKDK